MSKLIFIVSSFFEPNVNKVVQKLNEKKVPWIRFNTELFPSFIDGSWKINNSNTKLSFRLDNRIIDPEEITSVWYRRTGKFIFPDYFSEQERSFANGETGTFLRVALDSIDAHWINPREAESKSNDKPYQLLVAKNLGFRIPNTIVTNDPRSVIEFYNKNPKVVFKPLGGGNLKTIDYTKQIHEVYAEKLKFTPYIPEQIDVYQHLFTQILDEEKIEYIDSVQLSPLIFQEYIEKKYELRITVVGDRIFACAIYSQEFSETSVDFRRFAILNNQTPKHEKAQIPIYIQQRIMNIMQRLNLVFACIDIIVTPDDEYVFLEINPSGQWLWIEDFTGYEITDALVDNLIAGR